MLLITYCSSRIFILGPIDNIFMCSGIINISYLNFLSVNFYLLLFIKLWVDDNSEKNANDFQSFVK